MLQLKSDSQDNQVKEEVRETSHPQKRHCLITFAIIILLEAPQVAAAWITLAEKMPLLQMGYTQVIEIVLKTSAK